MDWVIGTALLVVLGIAGTYGVQAIATPSPSSKVTRADDAAEEDWGSVFEDVAEGTTLDAKERAAAKKKAPADMPRLAGTAKQTFPSPLKGTANTALNIQAVTAGSVVVANLQGYAAP